jgi:hypothetical protein
MLPPTSQSSKGFVGTERFEVGPELPALPAEFPGLAGNVTERRLVVPPTELALIYGCCCGPALPASPAFRRTSLSRRR